MAKVNNTENIREKETNHMEEMFQKTPQKNVSAVWDAVINPRPRKPRVKLAVKRMHIQDSSRNLGIVAPQLFNLDPIPEGGKLPGIKLSLYQMENV